MNNSVRTFGTVAGITQSPAGLDAGLPFGASISSIQRGIAFPGASASYDVTISPVDLTKTIVIASVSSNITTGTPANSMCKAKITTATNLNLTRAVGADVNLNIVWTVIEFNNLKSLQVVEPFVSNTTLANQAITSVNMSKTFIVFSHTSNSTTNSIWFVLNKVWLQSSTNVRIERPQSAQAESYSIYVVEFN